MQFRTILSAICVSSLLAVANAGPVAILDVYAPAVTYPVAGTVWKRGETHNVTWDASSPPTQITNPKGRIQLRKGGITSPLILANDFDILAGTIEVTVPWVVDGNDYSIVLFGDSGNWSGAFTITAA